MKRNPARIIEILIWPGIEVALFALLASSQLDHMSDASRIALQILTGIVYWNCTARIIQETVAQFIDDFTSKNIQSLLITPISLAELLISITAASITKIVISLAGLVGVIALVYPAFLKSIGPQAFLWVLQLDLIGVGLSFFAIGAICLFGERVGFIGWLISAVVQILSLVFYERAALPFLLRMVSYGVPSSYVFESIRAYSPGSALTTPLSALAFFLSIGYIALGAIFVSYTFRWAKRLGTFTKL